MATGCGVAPTEAATRGSGDAASWRGRARWSMQKGASTSEDSTTTAASAAKVGAYSLMAACMRASGAQGWQTAMEGAAMLTAASSLATGARTLGRVQAH
eukprot:3819230-Prymnesium_polylepis.1